ncbi:MAG TPA: cytidine deaminase [Anaerolineales bacterium]|nr:cytidine deaminase [Anaerolineales bacterium]
MGITDPLRKELMVRAGEVRRLAYAPYSHYPVGAALLADSGKIYTGVNVENAAYPTGMCAERTALFNAVSHGERVFRAIAVVTENGGSPCGACRQALSEFGLETQVLISDVEGHVVLETTIGELLPQAFGPGDLGGQ